MRGIRRNFLNSQALIKDWNLWTSAVRNNKEELRRISVFATTAVVLLTELVVMYPDIYRTFPYPDWNDGERIGASLLSFKSFLHRILMTGHSFWVHCCVSNLSLQNNLILFLVLCSLVAFYSHFDGKENFAKKNQRLIISAKYVIYEIWEPNARLEIKSNFSLPFGQVALRFCLP